MEVISLTASVATLILFVFYFIGRIWSIHIRKNEVHETVTYLDDPLDEMSRDVLENRKLFYSFGNEVTACITFEQPVRWVKVCKTNLNDFVNDSVEADEILHEIKDLPAGSNFYVEAVLPEGSQPYWIEYERYDYSKARIFLIYSGLSGNIATITNQELTKKSWKSWIYYLVR